MKKEEVDISDVLSTAMEAGRIMLENGAEIYRVENTMERIASHFGVGDDDFFVLSNGIFTTGNDTKKHSVFAKVKYIPVRSANLSKVSDVNTLSREIVSGKISLEEAKIRLQEIRDKEPPKKILLILATALGAASFSVLFGSTLYEALLSGLSGFVMSLLMTFFSNKYLSKVTSNLFNSFMGSLLCILLFHFLGGANLKAMLSGVVMPLVPGIAFVNGIRDIGDGDYLSGTVRLLDAILCFICIAIGVTGAVTIYSSLTGGIVL